MPAAAGAALQRLRALGFSEADADILAAHFLWADRRGLASHGVGRIAWLEGFADLDPLSGTWSYGEQYRRAETTATVIDPQVGETFAPASKDAQPAIEAAVAWRRYARNEGSSVTQVPRAVTVQLGLLTLPIGPNGPNSSETYKAKDELTWGFNWHTCPVMTLANASPSADNPCIEWLLLNAKTGTQIDETWQQ